jgi:hypothetical protein
MPAVEAALGRSLVACALALAVLGSGCATLRGEGEPIAPDPALASCDAESAARLRFLEPRLAAQARYAGRWWWTWNAVYVGGIGYGAAAAGFGDERGERAGDAVDAVKSAIGLGRNLLAPPVAREGVKALHAMEPRQPGVCAARLAAAEDLLERAAQQAHRERRSWRVHLGNLALNLAGAIVVAEGFDEGSGWGSGALGFVVGEIRIWTYPWQAERTRTEYERRFPRALGAAPRWRTESRGDRQLLVLD